MAAAHRGGRDNVGGILLGRGEDDKKVHAWLTTVGGVLGFIGFAVGRTAFWGPRVSWRARKTTREAAVAEIVRRYWEFVDIFEGLVLLDLGVRLDSTSSMNITDDPRLAQGAITAAIPSRSVLTARLRMPF